MAAAEYGQHAPSLLMAAGPGGSQREDAHAMVPRKPTASFQEILEKAIALKIVHPSALSNYVTSATAVMTSVAPSTVMSRMAQTNGPAQGGADKNNLPVVSPDELTIAPTFNTQRVPVNQNRMEFVDFKQLSSALKRLAMHCGFEIRVKYSSKRNKRWECREPGCTFILSGYKNKDDRVHVTDIELSHNHAGVVAEPVDAHDSEGTGDETNNGETRPHESRLTRNTTLSNELVLAGVFDSDVGQSIILKDPEELKLKDIQGILLSQFGSQISASMASRAKRKLVEMFYETSNLSYQQLRPFFEKVVTANPGSFYVMDHVPNPHDGSGVYEYGRCLLGIGAAIRFLKDCAPVLALEACAMNTEMHKSGILLVLSTRDYNSDVIYLALAHVPADDYVNWVWFLERLKANGVPTIANVTCFVSNGAPDIARAVSHVFPAQPHRFVVEHMIPLIAAASPSLNRLGPEVEHLIKQMAASTNMDQYMDSFQLLWRIDKDLGRYLEGIPKEHWVVAAILNRGWPLLNEVVLVHCVGEFGSSPLGSLLRSCNLAPCFYLFLLSIQKTLMSRALTARAMPDRVLLPAQQNILLKRTVESGRYEIQECRPQEVYFAQYHTVSTTSTAFKLVNIVGRTCTCGEWQQNHIPCLHAIAVLNCLSKNVLEYVNEWYFTTYHKAMYARAAPVVPVPPIDLKPDLTLKAPARILAQLQEALNAAAPLDPSMRSKPGPRPRKRKDMSASMTH
ncbi:hypothetical protein SPRG_19393 [Saprolegnia parasitica CBS 223.65]|uniref:SWIM-type domain-containing protein n=1 Tax=Saprolegnia parasitica (strain CBS 223.65) TaxID=695850 RepID=A0A067D3F0_SAPPC|nr:hypothetical protein SPRG_19393 [Saprolegnia parasitica CBS 223.65]KDO33241.1 hypothetical protein SPRG_19393 [Saprolegnia parasitica CBS 223.65]|eukprot:XP_012196272.1 hypothetical protein SPRG_19393 [Saprolegnia parasitica CBS 223.65]